MNKLKVFILSVLAVIFGSCSNAQDNKKNVSNSNSENMEGKKVLVAYFSWSGNTKSVAEYIAAKLNADKFEIVREKAYPTEYNACADEAKAEKEKGINPAIKGGLVNFDQYDVIFVGAPVWWYTAPMPVFTFMNQYNFDGKTVVPFCTCYTAEYETLSDIVKQTSGASHKDGITIVTKEQNGKGMESNYAKIDKWLSKIGF